MSSHASRPLLCPELVFEDGEDRAVKFFRLRYAHPMHFEADDVEPGAREDFDHSARPDIGKLEIVGLDQDERFLHFRLGRIGNDIIKNPAITVGKFGPQFQILFDRFRIE